MGGGAAGLLMDALATGTGDGVAADAGALVVLATALTAGASLFAVFWAGVLDVDGDAGVASGVEAAVFG